MAVAPAGLALVQDFLNTAGGPAGDRLADGAGARDWWREASAEWGPDAEGDRQDLDDQDAAQLRRLREEIKEALYARAAGEASGREKPLGRATVQLEIGPDGLVQAASRGSGAAVVRSAIALEMLRAQLVDDWRRLKVCQDQACRVAFYDRSRNHSGVWHDTLICGNAANLRASRARRRVSPAKS